MVGREMQHQRRRAAFATRRQPAGRARSAGQATIQALRAFARGMDISIQRSRARPSPWQGSEGGNRTCTCTLVALGPESLATCSTRRTCRPRIPADAIAAGIGYLPEDRKEAGVFAEMSVADNMAAAAGDRFGRWRYRAAQRDAVAQELCRSLRIVCRGLDEPVRNLSGGNQQKVILARWLIAEPKVLIVDEPTRGVDVGGKAESHAFIDELESSGSAVILIASERPEVLSLSTRIMVLREGRVAGELPRAQASQSALMRLMAGAAA